MNAANLGERRLGEPDFTKDFVKSKNPCAAGFKWYLRHHRDGGNYQQVLDHLVVDGRVDEACWLLDKVGPSNTVRALEELDCEAMVYAGTLEVRGAIEVGSVLRTGGALRCGGSIRAGRDIIAGGDIRAAQGLNCGGDLRSGGSINSGWHLAVGGEIAAEALKVSGSAHGGGAMAVAGTTSIRGELSVGGDCTARALSVRGHLDCGGSLRVWQGLVCEGHVHCAAHLDAGWGIKAGHDIVALGAIRAGEGLQAGGAIQAGEGYGIFAGLCVQRHAWPTCARVSASCKPDGLMSGMWVGGQPDSRELAHLLCTHEAGHAD